jgi:hypothetical protein
VTPRKRRILQERLSGVEFRNQQRQARRRLLFRASLDRQRKGQTREYYFDKEKRA